MPLNPLTLTPDERSILLAALAAIVTDNHAPQDHLTAAQWELAERWFKEINALPPEMFGATVGLPRTMDLNKLRD